MWAQIGGMAASGIMPAANKHLRGKKDEITSDEAMNAAFYSGQPFALKEYFNAVAREKQNENNMQRIGAEYQSYMNRDINPYDTEGFYQIPQYRVGGSVKAKNMMYAYGGKVTQPIEVEGNEVFEYPNGKMSNIKGPSHENGGVTMQAKDGSRIYSDRISARVDLVERFKKF